MRRWLISSGWMLAWGALWTGPALARAETMPWPEQKNITFVVPFSAGSGTDIVARVVAAQLAEGLGQPIVIENRPGAGGMIGAASVAKALPDGYTFLVHSSGHVVHPAVYPDIAYDTLADFTGITRLATLPNVMVAAPDKAYQNVADLVKHAQANPGALSYASAGTGSATHLNAEKFRIAAAIDALHIPFRGTPPALTETIAGRVDWFFSPLVSALPMIQGGQLQALAIGTTTRSPVLPNVPSISDVGLPGAAYTFWVGMFAPAGTPLPIIERMHKATLEVLESPAVRERFQGLGAEPAGMDRPAFSRMLEQELQEAAELVRAAGIRME